MHIAVCEGNNLYDLEKIVEAAKEKLGFDWQVEYFSEGTKLLSDIEDKQVMYDGIIIGNTLKDLDMIETGKQVRQIVSGTELAFISDSEASTLEAFRLNAVHYVLRPITREKVEEIFRRFDQRISKDSDVLKIKAKRKIVLLPMAEIVKIQSSKKRIDVYLEGKNETEKVSVSFSDAAAQIAEQTGEKKLVKISRGLIVNMDYIAEIKHGTCFLEDGTSILISRAAKAQIQEKYVAYLLGKSKGKGRGTVKRTIYEDNSGRQGQGDNPAF